MAIMEAFVFQKKKNNILFHKVSFCDHTMSVVHFIFKHLILLKHWVNLDEMWQGCSLGKALPNLLNGLNSVHNPGCHGSKKERKNFENLLF